MIDYGKPPSRQTQLPISEGFDLAQEVREWARDNPGAWRMYVEIARDESRYGEMPPALPVQILRHRHRVSVRNAFSPGLARLAMEQGHDVRFRLARSKLDPFFEVDR